MGFLASGGNAVMDVTPCPYENHTTTAMDHWRVLPQYTAKVTIVEASLTFPNRLHLRGWGRTVVEWWAKMNILIVWECNKVWWAIYRHLIAQVIWKARDPDLPWNIFTNPPSLQDGTEMWMDRSILSLTPRECPPLKTVTLYHHIILMWTTPIQLLCQMILIRTIGWCTQDPCSKPI